MSLNRSIQKFNKKITDPLGGINKLGDKWGLQDMTDLYREGPVGNASGIKQASASKGGSLASGRWLQEGKVQERPDNHNTQRMRTFDVFGSPATAGTGAQSTARAGAVIYGLWMGAGALGAGGSGGSGVGWGGTTSSSSAPSSVAGSGNPFVTNVGYGGSSVGSGTSGAASSPSWTDYSQQQPPQQEQQQEPQQVEPDYAEEDEARKYWSSRGMQLRMMADQAVQRYLG